MVNPELCSKEYIEYIDPKTAADLLSRNYENQRNVSKYVVDKYADDMQNGRWHYETAGPIIISDTGKVLDGQHRLLAVVKSGVTVPSYVRYDVPESSFIYIDANKPRTDAAFLRVPNATVVSAVARNVVSLAKSGRLSYANRKMSRAETLEFASRTDLMEIVESANDVRRLTRRYPGYSLSSAATAMYLIRKTCGDRELYSRFTEAISSPSDDPVWYGLQSYMFRNKAKLSRKSGTKADKSFDVVLGMYRRYRYAGVQSMNAFSKWVPNIDGRLPRDIASEIVGGSKNGVGQFGNDENRSR